VSERDRVKDWMRLISIDNILRCAPCSIVYWQCICMSRHIYRCIQRCHTQRVSLALGPDVVQNCEALTCHAILLLVWLTPFLASHRRKLLMAALVLGRFALSEVGKSDWHLQWRAL
jgi:hypothetical protein